MNPDLIERLCIARQTQHLSRDLADELLRLISLAVPYRERLAIRDDFIRQAARYLPGCTEQRANRLAELARRSQRPIDDVRNLLHQARLVEELPVASRSFRRILESRNSDS